MVRPEELWGHMEGYGVLWRNMEERVGIWRDIVRRTYGETWRDIGECRFWGR